MKQRWIAVMAALLLLVQGAALGEETDTVYQPARKQPRLYNLAGTGWLVEDWRDYSLPEPVVTQAASLYKVAGAFEGLDTYVYLAESSRTLDMDHLEMDSELWKAIQENYPDSTIGHLEIRSVEDYCRYFYKTDHHWNYRGSYQGYTDIIRMMLGDEEPLMKPLETVEFNVMFNGSFHKQMRKKDSDEPFTVYRFDYPEMTVKINGKTSRFYGRQEAYFEGKTDRQPLANHYGNFYGGDEGLVEFCTGDESRENVIIFSNSFSNAIDMLLATHFNHTYFIDMRHYGDDMQSRLDLTESIRKWNISKILLMGDAYFFKWGTTYR